MTKLHDMRKDYLTQATHKSDMDSDPLKQFDQWLRRAIEDNVPEPNAMVLSTANKNGQPASRILLLKDYDPDGFVFFTNYRSNKANELAQNPLATMLFWWQPICRQIRIDGSITKTSAAISDEYFQQRSKKSNICALASEQSDVIENRQVIEKAFTKLEQQYKDQEQIPRPDHWGGYILKPHTYEFWIGGPNRLHDRFRYTLQENKTWQLDRLAP